MACVYLVRCLDNDKTYVGMSTKTAESRWHMHVKMAQGSAEGQVGIFVRAIAKHGPERFVLSVLEDGLTREEALEREVWWIAQKDSRHPRGYNLTSGGECFNHHADTRQRLAQASRGRCWTQEEKDRLSVAHGGRPDLRAEAVRMVVQEGLKTTEVAEALGLHRTQVGRWVKAEVGASGVLEINRLRRAHPEEHRAVRLVAGGHTFQRAAVECGVALTTVSGWVQKAKKADPELAERLRASRAANLKG